MDIRTGQDFSTSHRNFVVPQDPQEREKLSSVDRKTKAEVGYRFGVMIDYDWIANTIANATLESIIGWCSTHLNDGGCGNAFNFYNLFHMFVTIKTNENAEKEGNINIVFEPGSRAAELIGLTEEEAPTNMQPEVFFGFPENKDLHNYYAKIDHQCRYELSNKYNITFVDSAGFSSIAVLYNFVENIYKYLLYTLANNPDLSLASLNFNDNIEFHAQRQGDGVVFYLRPGMHAKLLIKSDELTEDELGE